MVRGKAAQHAAVLPGRAGERHTVLRALLHCRHDPQAVMAQTAFAELRPLERQQGSDRQILPPQGVDASLSREVNLASIPRDRGRIGVQSFHLGQLPHRTVREFKLIQLRRARTIRSEDHVFAVRRERRGQEISRMIDRLMRGQLMHGSARDLVAKTPILGACSSRDPAEGRRGYAAEQSSARDPSSGLQRDLSLLPERAAFDRPRCAAASTSRSLDEYIAAFPRRGFSQFVRCGAL